MGWRDVSEEEILQANIEKYNNEHILSYYRDFKEPRYAYAEYDVIFSAILQMLATRSEHKLRVVDMCGGAGKSAFIFKKLVPQAEVTLVDLSEKMLDIARQRIREENIGEIEIVQEDAFTFLKREREFDIIVFSSAIHHFKDPVNLLNSAAKRLSDHGVIITIAEPNGLTKTKRYKTLAFLFCCWADKMTIMKRTVDRGMGLLTGEAAAAADDFDIAEYQAYKGINDLQLEYDLQAAGLNTLLHMQYPAGGEPFMTKIMSLCKLHWAFCLILTKKLWDDQKQVADGLQNRIGEGLPFKFNCL
ncbi:MAG: class SAM-dependent methyltransferase [Firmicutes bacterium]|nr:class SAM-dependent methyltransferase [Bacillota bacterium]